MASPISLSPSSTEVMEFPPPRRRSPSSPLFSPDDGTDEIDAELAKLENLRINVKQNLSLRPLKSPNAAAAAASSPSNPGSLSLNSASSSLPPTAIRLTFKDIPPPLALKSGSTGSNVLTDSSGDTASTTSTGTSSPTSPSSISEGSSPMLYTSISPSGPQISLPLHSPSDIIAHYTNDDSPIPSPPLPDPSPSQRQPATSLSPSSLVALLRSPQSRPLLLDTRPAGPYLAERIQGSINLAIPTLILKRWKRYLDKDKTGQQTLAQSIGDPVKSLAGFVTTEQGKEEWDRMLGQDDGDSTAEGLGLWNGDIIVYDEEMDETDPLTPAQSRSKPSPLQPNSSASPTTSWLLISVLSALPPPGGYGGHHSIYWLKGGLSAARRDRSLFQNHFIITSDDGGLDQLAGGGAVSSSGSVGEMEPEIKAVSYTISPTDADCLAPLANRDSASQDLPPSAAVSSSSTPTPSAGGAHPATISIGGSGVTSGSGSGPGAVTLKADGSGGIGPKTKKTRPNFIAIVAPSFTSVASGSDSGPGSHGVGVSSSPDLGVVSPPQLHLVPHPPSNIMLSSSPVPGGGTTPTLPQAAPFSYHRLYDASPSPSPSTTTANLPFPRTPTASSPSANNTNMRMRSRSNTGMLPKPARLDTKSRERLVIPPINTNLGTGSSSKSINTITTTTTNPPPLPTTSDDNTNNSENPNPMPPKLSLRTTPFKAATLAAPIASPKVGGFGLRLRVPPSPNRAASFPGITSPSSPVSGTSMFFTPVQTPSDFAVQYPFTPADSSHHSSAYQYASFGVGNPPRSPAQPTTPLTARPPPSPASGSALTSESESAMPPFVISTILPGFLFLGPELATEEQVEELQGLGVKRILNMAIECEPEDYGLDLERKFDRYLKIPMRDTVEEDRVAKGLKEVCDFVDDARLHSSPTYIHCKAGKSRSVTAVMAYLIHANHWPLSRAYSFVIERRKGVSPNIGFVSELMMFEEQKLGGKSVGVVPDTSSSSNGGPPERPRGAHVRDSLPPVFVHTQSMGESMSQIGVPITAGSVGGAAAGEEMEVKDGEGRYRHARRAPVNELTLQPLRRVSKAGLETTWL